MFSYFEKLIDPYKDVPLTPPPPGLMAFFWHYIKPIWPLLAAMAALNLHCCSAGDWTAELAGGFVDLMNTANRETFFADHSDKLLMFVGLAAVVLPVLAIALGISVPSNVCWQFSDDDPLAGASLRLAAIDCLFPG